MQQADLGLLDTKLSQSSIFHGVVGKILGSFKLARYLWLCCAWEVYWNEERSVGLAKEKMSGVGRKSQGWRGKKRHIVIGLQHEGFPQS
jgi:hypothetical protein